MGKKIKISAIILVGSFTDKKLLQKSLDSVSWCDEIVEVKTEKIKGGFSQWRNFGAKKAKGEWIFYIDTDEEATPNLKKQILSAISTDEFSGYAIPRRNILLGHEMKHGGWWPDFVLRLIKKDKFKGFKGELHEQPEIKGEIAHLSEPLIHRSHRSIKEMVDKTNEWSDIEAKLLFDSGHPPMNIFRFFSAGFREFWYRGILKVGFLDGKIGAIEVFYQTYSRLITYTKLWELQLKQNNESGNL